MKSSLSLFCILLVVLVGISSCKSKQAVLAPSPQAPAPPPAPPTPEPKVEEEEDATPFVNAVTISEGFNPEQLGASVTILSHSIEDRYLTLQIGYSGGCEEHSFDLSTDMSFMGASPPAATLYLVHHDNGDACEEYITETVMFDLSSVRNQEYNEMTITLFGYDKPIQYVY